MILRHLLKTYRQATEEEKREGKDWYPVANAQARYLAMKYGQKLETVCGVIAALSPSVPWTRNLKGAEAILRAVQNGMNDARVHAYGPNKRKAFRIARGEDPLKVLSGPKVLSFYDNLLRPSESEAVTIDGHAYSAWKGTRYTLGRTGTVPEITPRRYKEAEEAYKAAAAKLGIRPLELQATVWVAWRNRVLEPRYLKVAA